MIVAILVGELDERVGQPTVPSTALVIKHNDEIYVRTEAGIRIGRAGTAVGVVFRLADVYERRVLQ